MSKKHKLDAIELQDDDVVLSLSFRYQGPTDNCPSENEDGTASEANVALSEADEFVERVLFNAGYQFRHEYAWTDGSLYKYVLLKRGQTQQLLFIDIERALGVPANKRSVLLNRAEWHELNHADASKYGGWLDVKLRFFRPWSGTFRVDKFVNEIAAQAEATKCETSTEIKG